MPQLEKMDAELAHRVLGDELALARLSQAEQEELYALLGSATARSSPFRDAYEFMVSAVTTKNESTGRIESFPSLERWRYLPELLRVREGSKIFAVEKSRRMLVTWLFCCVYLYDTLTSCLHANFIVSKKLEDSAYLLGPERILGVWTRIPESVWPNKPELIETGKCGNGYELLSCPATGSYLRAIASGGNQLRQYTASNILFDEFAFQEDQEDAWSAALPTIQAGGHADVVSTPELGAFMYDLIYGTSDASGVSYEEDIEIKRVMRGLEVWHTSNGIRVARLHYTADPIKGTPAWKAEAMRGMRERDWAREMEIDWTVASGLPVFGEDFVREWHVSAQTLKFDSKLPILRGWDFGLTPSCIFCQQDALGRLNVLREMVTWTGRGEVRQSGIEAFAPAVIKEANMRFGNVRFIDYADPAGWSKAQSNEKSCVDIMRQHGIGPRKGPITFTLRRRAMREYLNRAIGGRPQLLVSPNCGMVIEGLRGAYKYAEIGETGRFHQEPEKNAHSHPIEALSYVVGALYKPNADRERKPKKKVRRDPVTGF